MAITIAAELGPRLNDVLEDLRSFYLDAALSGSPAALPSLMAFAKPEHGLFASNWPFAQAAAVDDFTNNLDAHGGLNNTEQQEIERGNATPVFSWLT